MTADRWMLAVAFVVVAGALCTGCGKDGAAGGAASTGSDQVAPGVTPSQSEIDRIKAQRMPPANLANQRPAGPGGQGGGGAPYGAPGGGTTYFKGN
jgi:hypothetical protein